MRLRAVAPPRLWPLAYSGCSCCPPTTTRRSGYGSRLPFVFCAIVAIACGAIPARAAGWIFDGVSEAELQNARFVGETARKEYLKQLDGVSSLRVRHDLYLDGLAKCNDIDRAWTDNIESDAMRYSNLENALWLEKAGLKKFTSLFMAMPVDKMIATARSACSKHEKQLTCGEVFEGAEVTMRRIEELKTIGNHKMMFEKECGDSDFVRRVYPCIGQNVAQWIRPCASKVNSYSSIRESVNARIESAYDRAVDKVSRMSVSDKESIGKQLMRQTMTSIAHIEGSKCGAFKQMRVCVLRQLLEHCNAEAMTAFNASISLGYLRTERRERLHLDFSVFNFPLHPFCENL